MNLKFKHTFFIIFVLFFIAGCAEDTSKVYQPLYSDTPIFTKHKIYIFGVHPLHNPERLFKIYQPMVKYINKRLKGAKLKLEASRDYATYNKKLFAGYFHFALPNPYQTVIVADKGYKIFGKMGDDENFRGIILVRKDSGIKQVTDLRGKTVSYPAPTALAATMMPQWYLYKHGLDVQHDITNSYVGSQESSIMNVYLGKVAAASTWPPPWMAFIKERPEIAKKVEIKWQTSSLVNNGLVARDDIEQSLVDEVSAIIFSMHKNAEGRKILSAMELSKYEKAQYSTYDPVREFLQKFKTEVRPIRKRVEDE